MTGIENKIITRRVLLSAVGTRGDVQPVLALALEIRRLGHDVRLCIPPNFVGRAEEMGFEAVPVGVEMRVPAAQAGSAQSALTTEQLQRLRESMPDLITDQFDSIQPAVEGCDVIIGANAHQYAAPSIAELKGIPYVSAVYAPVALPSPDHAPPPAPGTVWEPGPPDDGARLWREHARVWNERSLERINVNRSQRGLEPIDDVYAHVLGKRPWLAADPYLAPMPSTPGLQVTQTGDWVLEDTSPLDPQLTAFLDEGEPPIYAGFGSMPAQPEIVGAVLDGARSAGRRIVLGRGWANFDPMAGVPDCLEIEAVNHRRLFGRVAAVVHHGGAGTTAAAMRAGVPQVVVPMFSDQFYWAERVRRLGTGAGVPAKQATGDAIAVAIRDVLEPVVLDQAQIVAGHVVSDGAKVAAGLLVAEVAG